MIPDAYIVEWSGRVGWPTPEQLEQDLVLSRLILETAGNSYLGEELVFRGGTCLHKFHLSAVGAQKHPPSFCGRYGQEGDSHSDTS